VKSGVTLFLSSMIFAIIVDVAYAFTTHDIAGTLFLGFMALALIVLTTFVVVSEKEADLTSDDPKATASANAGETMGVFALESYWPILAAAGVALILPSVIFLPGPSGIVTAGGFAILFMALRFMVREST